MSQNNFSQWHLKSSLGPKDRFKNSRLVHKVVLTGVTVLSCYLAIAERLVPCIISITCRFWGRSHVTSTVPKSIALSATWLNRWGTSNMSRQLLGLILVQLAPASWNALTTSPKFSGTSAVHFETELRVQFSSCIAQASLHDLLISQIPMSIVRYKGFSCYAVISFRIIRSGFHFCKHHAMVIVNHVCHLFDVIPQMIGVLGGQLIDVVLHHGVSVLKLGAHLLVFVWTWKRAVRCSNDTIQSQRLFSLPLTFLLMVANASVLHWSTFFLYLHRRINGSIITVGWQLCRTQTSLSTHKCLAVSLNNTWVSNTWSSPSISFL